MLDYHNGKSVTDVSDGITFDGGDRIPADRILSAIPEEIIGTVLLKVEQTDDTAYLFFGHAQQGRPGHPADPLIVATLEATGDDLGASGE